MVSRSFPSVVTISFFSRLILLTRESDCDTVSEAHTKQSCVGRMKSGETQKICLAGAVPLLLAPSNRLSVSGPSAYLEEYFACFTAPLVNGAGGMALGYLKGLGEMAVKQVTTN